MDICPPAVLEVFDSHFDYSKYLDVYNKYLDARRECSRVGVVGVGGVGRVSDRLPYGGVPVVRLRLSGASREDGRGYEAVESLDSGSQTFSGPNQSNLERYGFGTGFAEPRVVLGVGAETGGGCGGCAATHTSHFVKPDRYVAPHKRSGAALGPNGGVSIGRGENYDRNRLAREKKRMNRDKRRVGKFGRQYSVPSDEGLKSPAVNAAKPTESDRFQGRTSTWSGVDEEVRISLLTSRAKRLIRENEMAIERADALKEKYIQDQRRMHKELHDGTVERKYQVSKNIVEGQLSGKYSPFVSRSMKGWAETVVSSGTGSGSSPALAGTASIGSSKGGSISANSSVSIEEHSRVLRRVTEMEKRDLERQKLIENLTAQMYRNMRV